MGLILRYAVRSDLGLVRGNNEDSVYAGPRLLAIADGMGGHAAGEVASKIVISTIEPLDDDRAPGDLIAALRDAVLDANQRLSDAVARNEELQGMGTTLTALRFAGSQVGLVHVGDSRAYLLRGEMLEQITRDDTYVQHLVDTGRLTPEEAKDHPRKSLILRVLTGAEVEPTVLIRESRAGDRYLLCSDGLSDVVSAETIAETLHIADPQECADRLVELALRGGGPDNVTVIVADVVNARPGDVIDDVPVIAGAFVDPAAADVPGTDSPAERAAAISRPKPQPATGDPPRPSRMRRLRTPLVIVGVLVLIAAALGGTYAWAQTQYYVGKAGDEVAIYQGVNTAFGPLKFSEVSENTDLKLDYLVPAWRAQVEGGITAQSKSDAESIVARLRTELIPVCRPKTPETSPTPSPTPSPTQTPSPTRSPSRHASTASTRRTSGAAVAQGSGRRSTTAAHQSASRHRAGTSPHRRASTRASQHPSSHTPSHTTSHTTSPALPTVTVPEPTLPTANPSPEPCRPVR